MLVISRRKGQRIVIGGEIEIVVVEASRGVVKIGVEAPARLTILRAEVLEAVANANRAAALAGGTPEVPRVSVVERSAEGGRREHVERSAEGGRREHVERSAEGGRREHLESEE